MSPIRICLISVYCLVLCLARTQSVYISPEINVKNDFSYYLLYHPDGTTSLLRDKSFKLILQTLYPDFTLSQEKTIDIPGKKWRIIEIYERQNHIGIFYLNKQESEYFMYYSEYNSQGILQSEKKLYASKELLNNENLKIISSADQNWMSISFYNLNHEKQLILYNRREDSIYYSINLEKILTGESKKFHFFEVSNKGGVYMFGRTNESATKKKMQAIFCKLDSKANRSDYQILAFDNVTFNETKIKFDNINNRFVIGGLYSERNQQKPKGYFICYLNEDLSHYVSQNIPFTEELLNEWNGKNKKSVLASSELRTRYVILKQDGGCLIFYENTKELTRRPYFTTSDPTGSYPSRWYDYYFDDIIVASLDREGKLSWDRVLHKRQYSQDDEGLFSSFFIFSTSALLRIVFNDAISSEGTVSEYLLRSDGQSIRKSILNTSYKNLNLRFQDAIEIDASSLLIPSENNGRLNLVKIVFD
jgi:hypothetical protein